MPSGSSLPSSPGGNLWSIRHIGPGCLQRKNLTLHAQKIPPLPSYCSEGGNAEAVHRTRPRSNVHIHTKEIMTMKKALTTTFASLLTLISVAAIPAFALEKGGVDIRGNVNQEVTARNVTATATMRKLASVWRPCTAARRSAVTSDKKWRCAMPPPPPPAAMPNPAYNWRRLAITPPVSKD